MKPHDRTDVPQAGLKNVPVYWLVSPGLSAQDWWACGVATLPRSHWDSEDPCAQLGVHEGSSGTAFGPAVRRLRSQSLLWGGSWTRRSSWCNEHTKRFQRAVGGRLKLLRCCEGEMKGTKAESHPFCLYTGMSSIAFRGNRRSSLRTCSFQETSLFLWVSEKAWHIERDGGGGGFHLRLVEFGIVKSENWDYYSFHG